MKKNGKKTLMILLIVAIIIVVAVVAIKSMKKDGDKDGNKVESEVDSKLDNKIEEAQRKEINTDNLEKLIDTVYADVEEGILPGLETTKVDLEDNDLVTMYTGLENGDDLKELVISQPLMSAQAYSFVLGKVKDGVDAKEVALKMLNVDTRRWICVEADQVYTASYGDVVCLIMSDQERAKAVYESFKEKVGRFDEEYDKLVDTGESMLVPEME